jgi:hypothetical protein
MRWEIVWPPEDFAKKIANRLSHLANNPHYPGLHNERIVNDPRAWSLRVDRRFESF